MGILQGSSANKFLKVLLIVFSKFNSIQVCLLYFFTIQIVAKQLYLALYFVVAYQWCYAVAIVFCNVVAKVLRVVFNKLLCGCKIFLGGC